MLPYYWGINKLTIIYTILIYVGIIDFKCELITTKAQMTLKNHIKINYM